MSLFPRLSGFFSGLENTILSSLKGRLFSRKLLLTVFFQLKSKKVKFKSFEKKENDQLLNN